MENLSQGKKNLSHFKYGTMTTLTTDNTNRRPRRTELGLKPEDHLSNGHLILLKPACIM